MKRINLFIGALILMVLGGCSTVDIRSASLKEAGLNENNVAKGHRILQLATWRRDMTGQWDRLDQWRIVTKDVWKSNLIRRLTPITDQEQELEFNFHLRKDQAQMKFLNGKRSGQIMGIDNDQPYIINKNEKIVNKDKKIKLYLSPVRDYFFWPQELVNSEIVIYEGQETLNDQAYHKIFVTDGSIQPSVKNDQYVVWINKKNMRIEFVEFTLREMLKSYRGVVEYTDYKKVQNMELPHRIRLKDKVEQDSYSHEFLVEDMSFKKPVSKLTFRMQFKPAKHILSF